MKHHLLHWLLWMNLFCATVADPERPTTQRLRKAYPVETNATRIAAADHRNNIARQWTNVDNDIIAWGRRVLIDDHDMSMSLPPPEDPTDEEPQRSPCVAPNVPEFQMDNDTNIGDTLFRPGPGFAVSCGPDCIQMQDSGDNPPFDPGMGDTLRFAYKQVNSTAFVIQSRVCGLGCADNTNMGIMGRVGLMVRDSLDPLARNLFISHTPNFQADWSWRTDFSGTTVYSSDGSPDVECLWIALERSGMEFAFYYAYQGPTNVCGQEALLDLSHVVTIDMPATVYVGLAVSSMVAPPSCLYTQAAFEDIECRGCS